MCNELHFERVGTGSGIASLCGFMVAQDRRDSDRKAAVLPACCDYSLTLVVSVTV